MHCGFCVTGIEAALKTTPGVISARANPASNAVDVGYHPEKTDFAAVRQAIESAGHRVAEPKPAKTPEGEPIDPWEEAARQEEYQTLMRKFSGPLRGIVREVQNIVYAALAAA